MTGAPALFEKTIARVGTPEDYRQLADLSDEYRVSFVTLAEVLEEQGKSPDEIRHDLDHGEISSRVWVTTKSAERTLSGLREAVKITGVKLRRKPKAGKHQQCGWLWHSEDVEKVAAIQRERGVSLRQALREFAK